MDERLREFERKRADASAGFAEEIRGWTEQCRIGALPASVGALVDRVAKGELSRERLALLAYAGDPDAAVLVGEETREYLLALGGPEAVEVLRDRPGYSACMTAPVEMPTLLAWLSGLERWGHGARIAAGIGIAERRLREIREDRRNAGSYSGEQHWAALDELIVRTEQALAVAWDALAKCDEGTRRVALYREGKLRAASCAPWSDFVTILARLTRAAAGEASGPDVAEPWAGLIDAVNVIDVAVRAEDAKAGVRRYARECDLSGARRGGA